MRRNPIVIVVPLAAACLWAAAAAFAAETSLDRGFGDPPAAARPWVYWYWMNGMVTKQGITADLESMQHVGIGGVMLFDIAEPYSFGIKGPVDYLGADWRALVQHTLREAKRLGLGVNIFNCPGWSSSGGPWTTAQHAMQIVVTSETRVRGPAAVDQILPQPPTSQNYYRDIAVVAFRTPAVEEVPLATRVAAVTIAGKPIRPAPLFDHNPQTYIVVPAAKKPQIDFEFKEPVSVGGLTLVLLPGEHPQIARVQTSGDGVHFKTVSSFQPLRAETVNTFFTDRSDVRWNPVRGRYWRVEFEATTPHVIGIAELEFNSGGRIANLSGKAGYARSSALEPQDVMLGRGMTVERESVLDLTARLQKNGRLVWDAPAGQWTILRLGCTLTGSRNRAAPKEGTGYECDKFSREALAAHWEGALKKILDLAGPLRGNPFVATHIDSYEAACQNWTPALREEFTRRRHYDPLPLFPVLSGRYVENAAATERFLWDYRRTLAELMDENYYGYFSQLCHEHGLQFSLEPYGNGNFDFMESGGQADLPMGEFGPWWDGKMTPGAVGGVVKLAASVGHTYARTIVPCESFTAPPEQSRWLGYPFRLKPMGDGEYCAGCNRLVLHVYAMQPWADLEPGMTLGPWGTHFGRTVTWWGMAGQWIHYLSRAQYLLQQGRLAADVCVFLGESAPAGNLDSRRQVRPALPPGYDYDMCDTKTLLGRMSVHDGRITLASGMSYRLLVLQQSRAMTPAVARKIRDLVRDGATVIGDRPVISPSLENYPACDGEVKKLAAETWGDCDGVKVNEHRLGRGKVICGRPFEQIFKAAGLAPDFDFSTKSPDTAINYIHRSCAGAEIYFLANWSTPCEATCSFRVAGRQPEFWNPDTGRIEDCVLYKETGGRTEVPIRFDPAGSLFVVFRKKPLGDHVVALAAVEEKGGQSPFVQSTGHRRGALVVAVPANGDCPLFPSAEIRAAADGAELLATEPGRYAITTASGKTITIDLAAAAPGVQLAGPWNVRFQANRGAPPSATFDKLVSWPEHADAGIKYFSGVATYRRTLTVPADLVRKGRRLWLDLGRVEVMAHVTINGRDGGVLWKPHFRIDVTDLVAAGENTLEVQVANLWANRLIGDEQLPADCQYDSHAPVQAWQGALAAWPAWLREHTPRTSGRIAFTWKHWHKDDPLLPSGLLGPVSLTPVECRKIPLNIVKESHP